MILTHCYLNGPLIKYPKLPDILHTSNVQPRHYAVTCNLNVQMKLLNPVLKKLHIDSVAVPN